MTDASSMGMAAGTGGRLHPRRHRGVGLIDVLLGVVVLALGAVGLARFQSVVMKEGNTAKARSVAVQLARGKLDDLRSYSQLDAGGSGVFGYDELGNNTGGAELADGSLRFPNGSVTVGNVAYTRSWTATPYWYCADETAPATSACVTGERPDFYALAVTVGWTDPDGTAQSVVLYDTANAMNPLSGATGLISGTSSQGPIVKYVPGSAPEVIAIDVGGGQKKETTNPTPTLRKQGSKEISTVATYETIRYDDDSDTITRTQFVTLNCSCTQLGVGTGEDFDGNPISKRIGEPSDSNQAFECDVCCRDHHDSSACASGTNPEDCYDPYRPTDDYTGGDHNHYDADGVLANDVGDVYVEACRLVRVDGFLRVAQDWRLLKMNAVPEAYFSGTGAIEDYGTYVKNYVAYVLNGSAGTEPTGTWSTSETVAKSTESQLLARGIYLDYVSSAKASEYATSIAGGDETIWQEIPFYEVNLTKLAKWVSGDVNVATVSNDDLVTEEAGEDLYSRGKVKGINPGSTAATASIRLSNTGVINEFILSDPNDASIQASSVNITVPGTTYTLSGVITGLPSGTSVTVIGTGSSGSSNVTCTAAFDAYQCVVPSGWSGAITATASGYTFSPGSYSVSNVTANNSAYPFTASTSSGNDLTVSGTITGAPATATVIADGAGSTSDGTCTYDGASGAYSCTVPAGWTGNILPSASGYAFSPGAIVVNDISSNLTADFTASASSASTFQITGTISAPPTQNTVTVSGLGSSSVTCTYTASSGQFSCTVPSGWTGSITPSSDAGIFFNPTSYNYSVGVSGDISGQNFTTSYRIAGLIAYADNSIPSGVTVSAAGASGNADGSCTYDSSNGNYVCIVPGLWYGSVVPSLSGNSFLPSTRSYENVTSPYEDDNYTAEVASTTTYTITVSISPLSNAAANGAGVQPVSGLSCGNSVVTGSGNSRTATITCTAQSGWNGTITPSVPIGNNKTATFSPASQSYSNLSSNQSVSFTCSGSAC